MSDRSWKPGVIAWSEKNLLFCKSRAEETILDSIPLHEIFSVLKMAAEDIDRPLDALAETARSPSGLRKSEVSDQVSPLPSDYYRDSQFDALFRIKTVPDGYNSGRTYFLRAQSDESCELIVSQLSKAATDAKQKLNVLSKFQKSQEIAKSIFFSAAFQSGSCLLILTVQSS